MRKPLPIAIPTTVKEVGRRKGTLVYINNDCTGVITLPNGGTIKGRRKRLFGICRYYKEDGSEVQSILGFLPLEWAYEPSETENQQEDA